MIKWCAYCQQFITEAEPFDDYRISHSICDRCLPKMGSFRPADELTLAGIIEFYRKLDEVASTGNSDGVAAIIAESRALGIRPVDLMMGLLQPLMAKVGERWAANLVTTFQEHRFSALVGDLLANLRRDVVGGPRPGSPDVILVNAEGNFHTFGLQMAEVYFAILGIPALTVTPGLPTDEVMSLVSRHKPTVLGFAVALLPQMRQVREVRSRLDTEPFRPRHLVVGGPALRIGLSPDPTLGIEVCRNLSDIPALLGVASR